MVVELGTEYLTVLQWQASHEQFIKDAFFSPGLQVRLDSGKHQASVLVDAGIRKEIMRGKRDYQVPMFEELAGLVSRMTGWEIKISR
jgi:transcription antitermination factor NusA-like protein